MTQPQRVENLSHAQRERLAYIDFRLYFFGEIGRPDLIERFGVAPAGATRDLALYREIAPQNITFDGSNKIYRIGQAFSPLFDHASQRVLSALALGFGDGVNGPTKSLQPLLPCESPTALSNPRMDVLAPVCRAIHAKRPVTIRYHSMSSGESERVIVPFALVDTGLRWHVRAFDRKSGEFRDFVITRIEAPTLLDEEPQANERPDNDIQWTRIVELDFVPQLKDEWKKITKPLEKEKEKPLRFLRYFLMANYVIKNERGDAVVREDEIYDWFIAKDNAALCDYAGKPFEFVRKVIRNVEHYLAFANGLGNDGKPSLAMDSLKRLAGGAFSLHFVLLLAAANFPKPLFDHFVAQLESFLFYYIFTKTPTKDLERSFSQWADELRAIAETSDPVKQKVQLNAFIAERFEKNMAGKSQELADALKRFTLYSMQQYRTRYLLARLTQHVEMAFSGLKVPGSLEPFTNLEIEHILPNKPEDDLRGKWATENPGMAYDDYKNRLGNLTLLEKPINIVAGNDFYTAKQVEYSKGSSQNSENKAR